MTQAPPLVVSDNPDAGRFEAHLGDQLAGVAEYQLAHDLIVFTHTEVEPAFEGRGVGSALAAHALSEVRAAGERRVLPLCPFIREWIQRHPEYLDITYGAAALTQPPTEQSNRAVR